MLIRYSCESRKNKTDGIRLNPKCRIAKYLIIYRKEGDKIDL